MDEEVEPGRHQNAVGKRCETALRAEPQRAHGGEQGQRSEQGRQQAPAPGIVAEQGDAERDQFLADQGMFAVDESAQRQKLARGGQIMDLVEIGMGDDGQERQAAQQEGERQGGAPADRVLGLLWRAAHRLLA